MLFTPGERNSERGETGRGIGGDRREKESKKEKTFTMI